MSEPKIVTLTVENQLKEKTAANWAADTEVYSNSLLFSTDEFYEGTDQQKFKKANGVDTWSDLDYYPIGEGGGEVVKTPLEKWHDRVEEQVLTGGDFKVFIVGDSLINSSFVNPDSTEITLFNYYREVFRYYNMDSIESAQAGITSLVWGNNSSSNARARYSYVSDRVIGDEGYDSAIFYFLGTNDYSLYAGDKALIKADMQSNIDMILSDHPKLFLILVSPPWSGDARTSLLREAISELATENELAYIDGALGTIGVSENYPNNFHTGDETHINRNGGRRTSNWVMYNAIPTKLHNLLQFTPYNTIEPATPRTNEAVILNNSRWFYNGVTLSLQTLSGFQCFDDIPLLENEIFYIVHDGNARQIYSEDAGGNIIDQYGVSASPISPSFSLREKFLNEEGWIVQIPNAVRTYVNIRTTGTSAVTEFIGSITRPTSYKMPQEDLIEGLPIQL